MIVLDASAAVDWLLQTPAGQRIESRIFSEHETLHAPHLLDLEVVQVLRRMARDGAIPEQRVENAVRDFLDLRITRYAHTVFVSRIWELRHNLSAYDAAYVVLTERLGATLVTRDARLVPAVGPRISVELF